ncbi:MAG: LytR C-terminal domain-containing protein [Actinomycetota bacterium]
MPGKHSPASPLSFILSVVRAVAAALAVLGIIVGIAIAAVGFRTKEAPEPRISPSTVVSASPSDSVTPEPTPTRSAEPTPGASLRPKSAVTVAVLNGTQRNGLAKRLSNELLAQGYAVRPPGNTKAVDATTIYYRGGAKADAEALRRAAMSYLSPGRVVPVSSGTPAVTGAMVIVVVGSDYPAL